MSISELRQSFPKMDFSLDLNIKSREEFIQDVERVELLFSRYIDDEPSPDFSYIDTSEYARLLSESPLTELFSVYLANGDPIEGQRYKKFFTNIWRAAAARNHYIEWCNDSARGRGRQAGELDRRF